MDVLRPPLIHIGGRIYRRNPVTTRDHNEQDVHYEDDVDTSDRMYEDEVCDAFLNIEEVDNGYRIKLSIPSAYFKFIIGKKGESKKRLENETRTQVQIPKAGHEGDIVIIGRDKKGVISAKTRIEIIVDNARQRQPFTHFLSIPINMDNIKDGFEDFKEDVLRHVDARGLDESIFQNPSKLHMTLGTLALMSDAEVDRANDVLQNCLQNVLQPMLGEMPLVADVEGLEYMNDDPGSVDVLYAKVKLQDSSERLQQVSEALVNHFVNAGLMMREFDRIKLHITVMNTLMRKDATGTTEPTRYRQGRPVTSREERESFDAKKVLELFGGYNFGTIHINTIHLSKRYTTGKEGYYGCAGSISLP